MGRFPGVGNPISLVSFLKENLKELYKGLIMSYCRFSSDNFGSDVYVYENCYDGFTVHVAGSRILGEIPKVPNLLETTADEYFEAHKKQMKFLETALREKIDLEFSGETFSYPTAREAVEKLEELREVGYYIPQYAINDLKEEITDE